MRKFRLSVGAVALATGLGLLTAATAQPKSPALPKETYKRVAAADIAFIQETLKGGNPDKRAVPTIKSVAMLLAAYGEATGDTGLTTEALKVAEAIAKKDFKAADAAAKNLAGAKGGAAPKAALHTLHKFDLAELMSPFRVSKVGGMNMEKDIRDAIKAGTIDTKLAEQIAVRSGAISSYTFHYPTDKATTNKALQDKWEKWSKEMGDISKQMAEEAGKAKADQKALNTILKKLDANCTNCHNEFRN